MREARAATYDGDAVEAIEREERAAPVDQSPGERPGIFCFAFLCLQGIEVARHLVLEGFETYDFLHSPRQLYKGAIVGFEMLAQQEWCIPEPLPKAGTTRENHDLSAAGWEELETVWPSEQRSG